MSTSEISYAFEPTFQIEPSGSMEPIQGRLFTIIELGELNAALDVQPPVQEATENKPLHLADKAEWHNLFDVMAADAIQRRQPLSVLFADIDGFKVINDKFGHQEGDRVIVEIQDLFSHMPHTPGRVGGDEFALAAPVDSDGIADIKRQIEAAFIEVMSRSENIHLLKEGIGITIGAATLEGDMTASNLLKLADEAMYLAKIESLHLNETQEDDFNEARLILQKAGIRLRDVMKLARKYPLDKDTI